MRYDIYAIREEHTGTSDRFSLRGNCDPLTCFLCTNVVYSLTRWHVANLVAYFKHLNSSISSIHFKDKQSGCFSSLKYSKTCVKLPLSKTPKFGFQDQLSLNAGQSIKTGCSIVYQRTNFSQITYKASSGMEGERLHVVLG